MRNARRIIAIFCIALMASACGRPLVTDKATYPTYGLANETSNRSKNVCYAASFGNIVWSILLIETVIVPIYFVGFSLYNPIRLKRGPDDQCGFDE